MARKKLDQFLNAIHTPNWVALLLLALFLLRIPSFFEPFNYGDEMIYLTLGHGINKGLVLYQDIHDNKPPLLYLTAAVAGNVFWFRVILAFWMMVTTIIFWKLMDRLFPKNTNLVKTATILFGILTTIPLLEGQTSNAELFLIGPTIAAFYIVVNKKAKLWYYAFSGLLLSIATLFKVPAAFDGLTLIFILFIILSKNKLNKKDFFQKSLLIVFGFITPIFISFVWYWLRGALNEYLIAAYLQNLGYLSSWRPGDVAEPFIVRNAPLFGRSIVMLTGYAILFLYRKKLSLPFLLGSAWLLSSLFAITLSERPYPHYLIQAVPAISLLFGMLVFKKDIEQSFTVIPLFLALFVPVYYNFWHYPTLPYYTRFINFATGSISKEEYFNRFEGNVNRNYEIAKFLRESSAPHDQVFVWGDSSTIYALSRRLPPIKYVATYHINDFASKEEIITAIDTKKPAYVIVLPETEYFNELNSYLNLNYMQIKTIDNAVIWRLINPRVLSILR